MGSCPSTFICSFITNDGSPTSGSVMGDQGAFLPATEPEAGDEVQIVHAIIAMDAWSLIQNKSLRLESYGDPDTARL